MQNQNRARGKPDHTLSSAAEDNPLQAGVTARAEDDKIDIELLRQVTNFLIEMPGANMTVLWPEPRTRFRLKLAELFVQERDQFRALAHDVACARYRARFIRHLHVDKMNLRFELFCECGCVIERLHCSISLKNILVPLHHTLVPGVESPSFSNLQMRLGNSPARAQVTARFFDRKDNDGALRLRAVASSANGLPRRESLSLADRRPATADPRVETPCRFPFAGARLFQMFAHGMNARVVRFIHTLSDGESRADLLAKHPTKIFAERLIDSQLIAHSLLENLITPVT
jgi:hypothetical protein